MLSNSLNGFLNHIFSFLTQNVMPCNCNILRKHTERLKDLGDFSFPVSVKPWVNYIHPQSAVDIEDERVTIFDYVNKNIEDILKRSESWEYKVTDYKLNIERISLFIHRSRAIHLSLEQSNKNNSFITETLQEIDQPMVVLSDLTEYRESLVTNVHRNLTRLITLDVRNLTCEPTKGDTTTVCEAVINVKNNLKEKSISTYEYIRSRQIQLTLIAQHKYGVRVTSDAKWKEFLAHLGESSVVFELLQVKPSKTVRIDFNSPASGSSKGAAFVFYNCARLETMIRTFKEKVELGAYPALPLATEVDFSLLTDEDEWKLAYCFLLNFPSVLDSCLAQGVVAPHQLCNFLSSLVRTVSQYYRRVRILTEPRAHLLPVMFARLHLLNAVNDTLKTGLSILNIKAVSQM